MRVARILLLAVVLLVPAAGAKGGPSTPFAFAVEHTSVALIVEQQSVQFGFPDSGQELWVRNPTVGVGVQSCGWDRDDNQDNVGRGDLPAGTVTGSVCVISDGTDFLGHMDHVDAYVRSGRQLLVSLTDSLGNSWPLTVDHVQGGWSYRACLPDTVPGPFPLIPDSNGGVGRRVDYLLAITATQKTRDVYALLKFGTTGTQAPCP